MPGCPLLLQGTGRLPSYYWTGLVKQGTLFYWPDGTVVNSGAPSNANPYAHFPWDFQVREEGIVCARAHVASVLSHPHCQLSPGLAPHVATVEYFGASVMCWPQPQRLSLHALSCTQDRMTSDPTNLYALAHISWQYDSYTGNSSYLQMQVSRLS